MYFLYVYSWVIPSTSLNESHDIPTDIAKDIPNQQLVDVTEIKGFEIEDEHEDQVIGKVSQPEKPVVTKDKLIPDESATKTNKPASSSSKPAGKPDKPVVTTDGKTPLLGGSNKSSSLQRSDRVEEGKDIKQKDLNVEKNESTKEGESSDQSNFSRYLLRASLHVTFVTKYIF